jgi:uncharacterized membrane protein YeaQ/YmgE (transglycosylase-associated protein family)
VQKRHKPHTFLSFFIALVEGAFQAHSSSLVVTYGTDLAFSRKQEVTIMNYVLWLIPGDVLGWITSLITGTNVRKGLLLEVLIRSVGAFLAGLFLTPLFGVSLITQYHVNVLAMLVSFLGAVVLLVIFNRFRPGSVTSDQAGT